MLDVNFLADWQGWVQALLGGLIGAVIGAIIGGRASLKAANLSFELQRKIEDDRHQTTAAHLRRALASEFLTMSVQTAHLCKRWNMLYIIDPSSISVGDARRLAPPTPTVFPAVAGTLGLLDGETASQTIVFYARLHAINEGIAFHQNDIASSRIGKSAAHALMEQWKRACETARGLVDTFETELRWIEPTHADQVVSELRSVIDAAAQGAIPSDTDGVA